VSSATPRTAVDVNRDLPVQGGENSWLSDRQQRLCRLYARFRAAGYDDRQTDWDGTPATNDETADTIARTGNLPPGFEMSDDQLSAVPLRFRRPCAPVAYGRVIPIKLTSLLFGSKKHPKIVVDDPATEDWLTGWAEAVRLWSKMKHARNLGGAMGAVGLGFKFVRGKPIMEVHDPRWCTPTFVDRGELLVGQLEKRYQYSEQIRTPEGYETVWFWHRRVISDQYDVVWPKVRVQDGEEPDWLAERHESVEHGYGFCPIVWVQNNEVEDSVDGDEDCHGAWELVESIDMLNSQCRKAVLGNLDPTGYIASDSEFSSIKKGSGTFTQLEKGGAIGYLELTGSGVEKGRQLRDDCLEQLCTVARVSLDRNEGGPSRTVEEVEHIYSSMLEKCDELREQYGELGVKRLLEMVLRAARMLSTTRVVNDTPDSLPRIVRGSISLPKRRVRDEISGATVWLERKLGQGEQLELRWPRYYTPSQSSVAEAVNAAGAAKQFGLLDAKHAAEYVAEDFNVENIAEMLGKVAREQQAASGMGAPFEGDPAQDVTERPPEAAQNAAVARQAVR
jgi:hypothetical protein